MSRRERLAGRAASLVADDSALLTLAHSRVGETVHAATILDVGAGAIDAILPRRGRQQVLLAVADDDVYFLECRRGTLRPHVGAVLHRLPLHGLNGQWKRRRLHVSAELSWPEQHVFIAATARPSPNTDRVIGLLTASELERYQ